MKATDLLKADHDRVEALFERFKKNENGNNTALFKQIRDELLTHTHIEEVIFYPFTLEKGKKDLKDIVREGVEEHRQVKKLLGELSKMTARNKQFNPKLKVVVEDVEHHVSEEEDDMFPLVEDQFSDARLEKLGGEMEAEKANFQKKHGIRPAPEPEKGTMASLVQKAQEVVSGLFTGQGEAANDGSGARGKEKPADGKPNSRSRTSSSKNKMPRAKTAPAGSAKVKRRASSKS